MAGRPGCEEQLGLALGTAYSQKLTVCAGPGSPSPHGPPESKPPLAGGATATRCPLLKTDFFLALSCKRREERLGRIHGL